MTSVDEQTSQADRFDAILTEHARRRVSTPVSDRRAERFEGVLDGFGAARDSQPLTAELTPTRISGLLRDHAGALVSDDDAQRDFADDFDLLDVLGASRLEQLHCRVLAWMLDHKRRRFGTHAQQTLGFELFLGDVGLPTSYAATDYEVRREVPGDNSRIDVEVACRGRFLIHIEVKVYAATRDSQLVHEAEDARRRAAELGIGDPTSIHTLYLTRSGRSPSFEPSFQTVSWGRIAGVFEKFASKSRAPDVRLFASRYARSLRSLTITLEQDG